jgi:hypothetical protein
VVLSRKSVLGTGRRMLQDPQEIQVPEMLLLPVSCTLSGARVSCCPPRVQYSGPVMSEAGWYQDPLWIPKSSAQVPYMMWHRTATHCLTTGMHSETFVIRRPQCANLYSVVCHKPSL